MKALTLACVENCSPAGELKLHAEPLCIEGNVNKYAKYIPNPKTHSEHI